MTNLYLITSTAAIPTGTRCRMLGDWPAGGLLIQSDTPIPGAEPAPATWPNGEPTDPDANPQWPCVIEWQIIESPIIPVDEIRAAVAKVNEFAVTHTDATRDALLEAAPITSAVNLYNSDGVERIKAVE